MRDKVLIFFFINVLTFLLWIYLPEKIGLFGVKGTGYDEMLPYLFFVMFFFVSTFFIINIDSIGWVRTLSLGMICGLFCSLISYMSCYIFFRIDLGIYQALKNFILLFVQGEFKLMSFVMFIYYQIAMLGWFVGGLIYLLTKLIVNQR